MAFQLPQDVQTRLKFADQFWYDFRHNKNTPDTVIYQENKIINDLDFDIIICGGNLGIFIGATLQQKGYKIAII